MRLASRDAISTAPMAFCSPNSSALTPTGELMMMLKRLVHEIREVCPRPYYRSVKLSAADYMAAGGLSTDEGLEQVRWLAECGMVDFVKMSGCNAENSTSKLHNSFGARILDQQ